MMTATAQGSSTLTVTDNRTGKVYEIPIVGGAIPATALRQIKISDDDFGLLSYDPAFMNTANCRSAITFIDGERGILRYRGYPIQELAEHATFLEVAYLLLQGELPTTAQLDAWVEEVTSHTFLHENIKKVIDGFHHDAHPMGILIGTIGALSTFYPDAKRIFNADARRKQIVRLIAKISSTPSTCCSSCTPTTSRTARPRRCARWAARMPTRTPQPPQPQPPSTAHSTAVPTSRCCAC